MQYQNAYDSLIYFTTLVEQGTLKKTSEVLGIDFKTLKKKIELLEIALQKTLITKDTRNTIITDDGMRLYALVCNELKFIDDKLAHFKNDPRESNQSIQISLLLPPTFALYFSLQILPNIEALHPHVHINIDILSDNFMLQHGNYLRSILDKYEVVLINRRALHLIDDERWMLSKDIIETSNLYAADAYLDKHSIKSLNDLKNCRLITQNHFTESHKLPFEMNNCDFSVHCSDVLNVENNLINLYLTQGAHGIGIIPDLVVKYTKGRALRRILPQYTLMNSETYKLIYKSNPFKANIIKSVLDHFKQ